MNLQVLEIRPSSHNKSCQVRVKINQVEHQLTMRVETELLNHQPLQIIQGDENFHRLFQRHRELAQKIYALVSKIDNQENFDFPVNLNDFDLKQEPILK